MDFFKNILFLTKYYTIFIITLFIVLLISIGWRATLVIFIATPFLPPPP